MHLIQIHKMVMIILQLKLIIWMHNTHFIALRRFSRHFVLRFIDFRRNQVVFRFLRLKQTSTWSKSRISTTLITLFIYYFASTSRRCSFITPFFSLPHHIWRLAKLMKKTVDQLTFMLPICTKYLKILSSLTSPVRPARWNFWLLCIYIHSVSN